MGVGQRFKAINTYLARTSVLYTFSSVIQSLVQLVSGLLIANFIIPSDYGLWNKYYLLLTYLAFLQFGINSGINLELPLSIGRKDFNKVKSIVTSGQYFYLFLTLILAIIGVLYTIFYDFNSQKEFFSFLGVWTVLIFTFYQNFLLATFRTNESFRSLAKINFIQSILNLILTILIVYFLIYGLILKSVITIVIYVIFLHYNRPYKVKLNFKWDDFKPLLFSGFPIFILSYFQISALNFDKLIVVKFENDKALGIYSFAYLGFTSITIFSTSLATYIYPKLSEMVGNKTCGIDLWNYIKKVIPKLIFLLIGLALLGSIIGPFLILKFFPNYSESIELLRILLFAGAINGSLIGVNLLLSLKNWKLIIIYYLSFMLITISCQLTFYLILKSMVSLAVGVLISNIFMVLVGYLLVYYSTSKIK